MRRLRLTIAYDGRPWQGWQSQASGLTVQDQIESAFAKLVGAKTGVQGSGRTDTGVHALAQVAHVDVPADAHLQGEAWLSALNAHLPRSIRVLSCEELGVGHSFHARFDAVGKVYEYRIRCGPVMSPFEWGLAWHVWGPLDRDALQESLPLLLGTHNFARLSANRGGLSEEERREDEHALTRTIQRAQMFEEGGLLRLEFEGDGFLYKMVRIMVGSLMHIARGKARPDWLRDLAENPAGEKSHHCAPPDGLYLVRVKYGPEQFA
jgi:tRNA pseudouridine38-40 synthase